MANSSPNNSSVKYLSSYAKQLISQLKGELLAHNKVASHGLVNSIEMRMFDTISNIKIEFLYNDYGKWIEAGRKPGKFVPVESLKSFLKFKGIDEKFCYPINLSIKEKGIKPFPFVENILKARNVEEALAEKLAETYGDDLEIELESLLSKNVKQYYNN